MSLINLGVIKNKADFSDFFSFLKTVLAKEKALYWLIIIYSIGIGVLSLATPIAVKYIIGNITFTALLGPLIAIVIILVGLLIVYTLLKAMQMVVIHIFTKHFFTRIVGDIFNSFVYSDYESFERCNRTDIANRFFEIITIQKVFPSILFGGLSIIQQVIIGFIFISFYHVSLLAFSVVIALLSYLIVRAKGMRALNSLYDTSTSKYAVVDLLENISRMHKEFKSNHAINYSRNKVNAEVSGFLKHRDSYFSALLFQSVSFLLLYIFSSCGLLLIGSILVFEGNITVGQLIAMELVVSTTLYQLSEFSKHLDSFYELAIACRKIDVLYKIKSEADTGVSFAQSIQPNAIILALNNVIVNYQNKQFVLNLSIPHGSSNLVAVDSNNSLEIFYKLLLKFIEPSQGDITYYGHNIELINQYSLRDKFYMIDSTDMYQCSIKEYLTDNLPISTSDIQRTLSIVQLNDAFDRVDIDLDHSITPGGYPFSPTQIIRLKIAKALLYKPELLILGTIVDRLEYGRKQYILQAIRDHYPGLTIIHFTNMRDYDFQYDNYFFIEPTHTHAFQSVDDFTNFRRNSLDKKL